MRAESEFWAWPTNYAIAMKPLTTRFILFLLIALGLPCGLALMAQAQNVPVYGEPPLRIYRGNVAEKTLYLPAGDALKSVAATTYYVAGGRPVDALLQPTVTKTGVLVRVVWNSTLKLPDVAYTEVKVGGQTRWAFQTLTDKRAIIASNTPPLSPADLVYVDLYGQLLLYNF